MPITYSIDQELGIAFAVASGVLTDGELLQHRHDLFSDPNFSSGFVELSDLSHIEKFSVTSEGIQRLVARDLSDSNKLKTYRLAIVAPQDLAFGMARMYEMTTSDNFSNVKIFRDIDEARTWLMASDGDAQSDP